MQFLAAMALSTGWVSAQCTSPYTLPKFQAAIAECKLQAPNSSTRATQSELMGGFCNHEFELLDTDKMAFYQTGSLMRSELRYLDNWFAHNSIQVAHANVQIISQTCDQVTILQIHDDANAGVGTGPNKPLLRIYRHLNKTPTDHIWAVIKTDDTGANNEHIDLGPTPSGYFDCDITINNGSMEIAVNGTSLATRDISYWTFPSYWKAGAYLQDAGEATVYFNELTWTQTIGNQAPSFASDPINEVNATENVSYNSSISDNASDPESDAMTFSKVSGPAWLSVATDGTLSGSPGASDVGDNVFTVQVDDAEGDDTATLNIKVIPEGLAELTNDDFEDGWGNWTDGGDDAYLNSVFAIDSQCIGLQDDSSASVATLTNALDLTGYAQVYFDFSFVVQSYESGESFFVEYSDDGGSSWATVKEYLNDTDFVDDGTRYNPSHTLDPASYNFTNNAKFRFRSNTSGNGDDVYIDEVIISGFVPSSDNEGVVADTLTAPGGAYPGETDQSIIGHGADPDQDGQLNIFEVWRGTDSGTADQATPLVLEEFSFSGTSRGSVIIETDSAMDDALVIGVEISFDLINWRNISNNRQVIADSGSTRTLRFYDFIAPPNDFPYFVRFSSDPTAAP